MSTGRTITLGPNERIDAVVPEVCAGPGYCTRVVWVYVRDDQTGRVRVESLQPTEQSAALRALFAPGAAMCAALLGAVAVKTTKQPKEKK